MTDFQRSEANERLLAMVRERRALRATSPEVLYPWWRPCTVRALLVADGPLDFGPGDFGLSTFVDALVNDRRPYVRFEVTRVHRGSDSKTVADEHSFRFDAAHGFTVGAYDEVWLFGFDSGGAIAADEVAALSDHMAQGGGVFATGDHASLGKALCGDLPRVREMRYWDSYPTSDPNVDQVSMGGQWRNDTNQIGTDPGSQFSDQSDDIPQTLDLKLYSAPAGLLRQARWPHPVLCSRYGRIDKFPDHPHEGGVHEPESLTTQINGVDEFPMALDGSGRVSPEVVAYGRVLAGNTAIIDNKPTKAASIAHSFGVVATYDGHRAGVGRIVCDSTWHHFVNVNLIGVVEGGDFDDFPGAPGGGTPCTAASKHVGFLNSKAGEAVLDRLREYYVNIGTWIAPADRHKCFASRFWFDIIWDQRVVEASLTHFGSDLSKVSLADLRAVGIHARDVIGRAAGVCQSLEWVFIVIDGFPKEIRKFIDPWPPPGPVQPVEAPLPFVDLIPLLDLAVGGAVLAIHERFPYPVDELDTVTDTIVELVAQGSRTALQRGLTDLDDQLQHLQRIAASARQQLR